MSTECTPLAGSEWAAVAQRVAAVTLLVLGTIAFVVVFASGRKVVTPPKFRVSNQAYFIVTFAEAVVLAFLSAYVIHLLPCLWSECLSDRDATVSAILLVSVWPVGVLAVMGARFAGNEQFTLFRKVEATDETDKADGFFQIREDDV